jgi:molybdate transport system ATP-binding protein
MRGDEAAFERIVQQLAIGHLLARYPATLSGGEARRVAIGRALLTRPSLLLLDEPLTGLDTMHKRELLQHIRDVVATLAIPVVYISHDAREIAAVADHIALLDQGRLVADGALPEVLSRFDLTPHLGGFDAIAVLAGTVRRHDPDYHLTHLALPDGQELVIPQADASVGSLRRVHVPIRDVALALNEPSATSYRNRLRVTLADARTSNEAPGIVEVRLAIAGQTLRARLTRRSYDELDLAIGMELIALVRSVAFDPAQ